MKTSNNKISVWSILALFLIAFSWQFWGILCAPFEWLLDFLIPDFPNHPIISLVLQVIGFLASFVVALLILFKVIFPLIHRVIDKGNKAEGNSEQQ